MKTFRVVLAAVAVMALISGSLSTSFAQNYKRHALIEEGTGVWCGYCPYGAYTIDSMVSAMGDNLVVVSWHGPAGYGEPMYAKAEDTVAAFDSVTGYPWASPGRTVAMSGAYEQGGSLFWPNPWYTLALSQAEQAPIVDFRIVNAVYSNNAVDFDVDITPISSRMPTEDTTKYYTVSVVTEDGVVESQHIYDNPNESDISDFRHYNVARAVGGKVLGDLFTIKTAKSWPIRRHYHIALSSDWVSDSLRIKAFSVFKGSKSHLETYLNADQTGYITKLPSTAPAAVWPILPVSGESISGDSTEIPIVWASGGGVTNVSIDYSVDGGTTWSSVVSSTSQSPYEWQLPGNAYSNSVMLRIGDPANHAKDSVGPAFSLGTKPQAIITLTSPAANDSLLVGTTHSISFTTSGPVKESSITLSYSTDSMATWNTIATISNATSYSNWQIPNTPSTAAFVRVTDANGVEGISPQFSILDSGTVSNVTLDGAPTLPIGTPETIHWNPSGYLGESLNISLFDPALGHYTPIAQGLSAALTSYMWTTIPSTIATGYKIQIKYASGATGTSDPFAIGAAGVISRASSAPVSLSPNPFTSNSQLRFTLAEPANVTLVVRDLLGREVLRSAMGTLPSGAHEISIDGTKLTAGSYEYELVTGANRTSGRLTILH